MRQWIHKAKPEGTARIDARLDLGGDDGAVVYSLAFMADGLSLHLSEELKSCSTGEDLFSRAGSRAKINRSPCESHVEIDVKRSVFADFRDPRTAITRTGQALNAIEIFREFNTGPSSSARNGVAVGSQKFLLDGGGNLALALQELDFRVTLSRLNEYLTRFWEEAEAVRIRIDGGILQTYVKERGIDEPLPAIRLSDGTLRYLCLMAILLHPAPPPLICIEEPELGLHPDALTIIADALKEASERSQLIVTTHSEALMPSPTSPSPSLSARGAPTAARSFNASMRAPWPNGWRNTGSATCGGRVKSAALDGDRNPGLFRGCQRTAGRVSELSR